MNKFNKPNLKVDISNPKTATAKKDKKLNTFRGNEMNQDSSMDDFFESKPSYQSVESSQDNVPKLINTITQTPNMSKDGSLNRLKKQ